MVFEFEISNDFESKKELLSLFYPNLKSNQSITLSNENSTLQKMCKKNENISLLMERLDMIEC